MKFTQKKNHKIFLWSTISIFSISIFFLGISKVYAALSCSVTTAAACTGTTVLRMSGSSNAHSELPAQSNSNYDSNVICCSGVAGLGNSCSGTYGVIAKLSAVTNAHVEENTNSNFAQNACMSNTSGTVTIGYQNSNCTGYDTTLGSISASTNAQIGDGSAYTRKICASSAAGTLGVDIVDSGGTSVSSPSVSMSGATIGFGCQTTTGTFGTSSEKIRVTNSTGTATWTLSVAASAPTDLWTQGTNKFDFNDSTGSGCTDGADADAYGGQLTQNPSGATVTPQSGCNNTGISLGSSNSFVQGTTDSITLVSASSGAGTGCYWDITGVGLSQKVPLEQTPTTYNVNFTVTIVSS